MSYIKREPLLQMAKELQCNAAFGAPLIARAIEEAPEADVVEVRHGYWVRDSHREEAYCSLCDGITPVDCEKELFYESDYCPNCGAKMDGK